MSRDDLISKLTKTLDNSSLLSDPTLGLYVKQWIPTGVPSLDIALGTPGIPCGRVTTIRGKPATGKSTLVCQLLASCQSVGGLSILVDSEYAYDPQRSKEIGMNMDTTIVLQPNSLEDTFNQIDKSIDVIRDDDPSIPVVIAIDSVAGLPTEAETATKFGDGQSWGSHAKILSLAMRRIVHKIADQRIALIFVNQTKERTDIAWGDSDTMIGDNPIMFHSSIVLKVSRVGTIGDKDPRGITSEIKVVKNKLAPPLKVVRLDVLFKTGIDIGKTYAQAALSLGLATKKGGGWVDYDDLTFKESEMLAKLRDAGKLEEFNTRLRAKLEEAIIGYSGGEDV